MCPYWSASANWERHIISTTVYLCWPMCARRVWFCPSVCCLSVCCPSVFCTLSWCPWPSAAVEWCVPRVVRWFAAAPPVAPPSPPDAHSARLPSVGRCAVLAGIPDRGRRWRCWRPPSRRASQTTVGSPCSRPASSRCATCLGPAAAAWRSSRRCDRLQSGTPTVGARI